MYWILSMITLHKKISRGLEKPKHLKMIRDVIGLKIFLKNVMMYIFRWQIKKNKWTKNMKSDEEKNIFGQLSSLFHK